MNKIKRVGIIIVGVFLLYSLFSFVTATPVSYTQPIGVTPIASINLPFVTGNPDGFFYDTYDGDPANPMPWYSDNWSVTVHSRDVATWSELEVMNAQHGQACDTPPATHPVTAYEDAVYNCKNHLMTAINASGYGLIYRTPNQMVDFSQEEGIIRFDMSTLRTSGRDWVDIYISPYEDNLQLALMDWLPDLSGDPKRAVHIQMDLFNEGQGLGTFKAYVINNFYASPLPVNDLRPYDNYLDPSSTKRETFEIHISQDHIAFGMADYGIWWVNTDMPPLDWNQGVVQFGHHSYNPTKACGANGTCTPNTWHWDNILIQPTVPFTIIHADRRFVDADNSTISLSSPAPANAHLRFAGIGTLIEVSFDGGQSWEPAQFKVQERYTAESFWSYWTPIPEGTTSVQFRGSDWWGGPWHARDITVWSQD